jgi:hypothetical protein
MASTCKIYKGSALLGSGSIMDGSFSVTGWVVDSAFSGKPILRRNVSITNTQAGTHQGRTWRTRVTADNGAGTLTIADKCPHVGA